MRSWRTLLIFIVLFPIHVFLLGKAGDGAKTLPRDEMEVSVIPAPILKITSLEFRGLASDLLFLKALVFYGSTFERKERPRITPLEWNWFYHELDAATDLDPYFIDPYLVANSFMTWEGGMIKETNALLEKASRFRDWDWMPPFYIGFNQFYFLHDNAKAAEYLYEASKRPGPSEQLVSIAARLEFKERNTETAIIFLEAILKKTDNEYIKKDFEDRIKMFRIRLFLEKAVAAYKIKYGVIPENLDAVLKKGIIREIPSDPYKGTFSLDRQGRVLSTSDNSLMPGLH
jgi:hypothetical protein